MIQNILKNIFFGTLVILMSVPFCFAQSTNNTNKQESGFSFPRIKENGNMSFPLRRESNQQIVQAIQLNESYTFHQLINYSPVNSGVAGIKDSLKQDTTLLKQTDKKFRMKKSPWLAVGLSALFPGAGQFYNKSYWKVPVILGLAGYLAYEFYDNDKKYRDYRDRYSATQTPENPSGDENLKILREFYFDQRNDFVWYFTIVYVINLVDAYVDAHLFDFDVREEKLTRFGVTDKEYKLNVNVNF